MNGVNIKDLPPNVREKLSVITEERTADLPVEDRYAILGKVLVLVSTLTQGDARWVCREVLRHLLGRAETRGGHHPKHKHIWSIESPNGGKSLAVCKSCGAMKEYYNSLEAAGIETPPERT